MQLIMAVGIHRNKFRDSSLPSKLIHLMHEKLLFHKLCIHWLTFHRMLDRIETLVHLVLLAGQAADRMYNDMSK